MSNRHELPELPEDDYFPDDTMQSETRAASPVDYDTRQQDATSYYPAAPQMPPPRVQQAAPVRERRPGPHVERITKRGRARARRESGFYLPLWSLGLMLLGVVVVAAGIVIAVLNLGGREAPEADPIVVIITAPPTERPAEFPAAPATPTIPPEVDPNVQGIPDVPTPTVALALSGPTLAPVVFSPTPRVLGVGERVIVQDVAPDQLNVRDNPGVTDSSVVFRASEDTAFVIVDGPQQADGLTWWQVQDPNNNTRIGWAASNYLVLAPEGE